MSAKQSTVIRSRIGVLTYLAPREALIDRAQQEALNQTVTQCIAAHETELVIDFANIPKLNSSAIETLLDIQDKLARLGGWLELANTNTQVQQTLYATRLSEQLKIIQKNNTSTNFQSLRPSNQNNKRLGDILLERKLTTEERITEAMQLQEKLEKRMGQIMIDKGWVAEKDLLSALSEQLSTPHIHSIAGMYDKTIATLLDKDSARRLMMLPLFKIRGVITLATSDPQALSGFSEIEERTRCRVQALLVGKESIVKTINEAYEDDGFTTDLITEVDDDFQVMENLVPDDYEAIDEMAAGSPIVNLVNSIIQRAVRDGASDIHIEPSRTKSRVRYRIDGILYEVMTPRMELHHILVSRLKVMANLDIAERRLPQDGRIQVHTHGRLVDLRFSSLPGLYGEKIVLRVLDKNNAILDINKLGMSDTNLTTFKKLQERSYGLILVTGPTGSGKTTSLYAALNHLNSIEKNIVTIEDPIEYQLDIINQNEVRNNISLSFSKMLKHVLRQDPDIIMVGEIREKETAEIAVQAALTGHLVLSTLHTNDSIGAITRMVDMGVEPYLLSSALIGVIAQRLVRTICPNCKTEYVAPPEVITRFGWPQDEIIKLARGRGCSECYDSGYKGRICIHEILEMTSDLQQLIISNPNRNQLSDYLVQHKVKTLFSNGMERAKQGKTTIEEVSRVINT